MMSDIKGYVEVFPETIVTYYSISHDSLYRNMV